MAPQPFSGNLAKHIQSNAKNIPDSLAVILHSKVNFFKTFSQLHSDVANCACYFQEKGIKKNDRSLLMVKPGYELIVCCFALIHIGAIPIIIDPGMGMVPMLKCIKISKPKNLIAVPLFSWISHFFRFSFSTVNLRLSIGKGFAKKLKFYSQSNRTKLCERSEADLAAIVFTSGSTGTPKGVRYLVGNFNAQVQVLKNEFGIKPDEVDLVTLPVFSLFNPALGVTSVIPKINTRRPAKTDPKGLVDAILKYNTTTAFCSPVIGRKIVNYCLKHKITLPRMKRMMLAGAPSPPTLIEKLATRLPNGRIIIPYGATEALPVSYSDNIQNKALTKSILEGGGSNLGKPIKDISIILMALKNSPLPNENEEKIKPLVNKLEVGEICVAGSTVTDGYDQMPGATRDSRFIFDSKEYHRMGDLGYWDNEGNLRFMGRKAECIQTIKGPIETERCEPLISDIEGVKECALIGVGRGKTKEPCLVIEPVHPSEISKKELLSKIKITIKERFPNYCIRRIFLEKKLPVDARHNAKIHRLALARKWSAKVARHQNLGLFK